MQTRSKSRQTMKKVLHADGLFTIVALPGSTVGDVAVIDGIAYTIVDESTLRAMIDKAFEIGFHIAWQNVSRVCTSKIRHMDGLFQSKRKSRRVWRDLDVSHWDTSNVLNMENMFYNVDWTTKHQIGNWNTSNVQTMENMFARSNVNDPSIAKWNTRRVENMKKMFKDSTFNQFIGKWDTSHVKTMAGMFEDNTVFNEALNSWDVSRVQDMSHMFSMAKRFNRHLSKWNTSNVQNMKYMFFGAESFNKPIGNWDVSNVIHIDGMFSNAINFNQDLSQWKLRRSTISTSKGVFWMARSFVPRGWSVPVVKKDRKRISRGPIGRDFGIARWTTEEYQNLQDIRRSKHPKFGSRTNLIAQLKRRPREPNEYSPLGIDNAISQYMRNAGLKTPLKPRLFKNVRYLYRGLHSVLASQLIRERRLHDPGYIAFSRSEEISERYARGGIMLRLDTWKLPAGIPWIWFHGENRTSSVCKFRNTQPGTCGEENEVLFPPGELVLGHPYVSDNPDRRVLHYITIDYIPAVDAKSITGKKIIRRIGPPKLDSTEPQTAYDRKIDDMYHKIMNQKHRRFKPVPKQELPELLEALRDFDDHGTLRLIKDPNDLPHIIPPHDLARIFHLIYQDYNPNYQDEIYKIIRSVKNRVVP